MLRTWFQRGRTSTASATAIGLTVSRPGMFPKDHMSMVRCTASGCGKTPMAPVPEHSGSMAKKRAQSGSTSDANRRRCWPWWPRVAGEPMDQPAPRPGTSNVRLCPASVRTIPTPAPRSPTTPSCLVSYVGPYTRIPGVTGHCLGTASTRPPGPPRPCPPPGTSQSVPSSPGCCALIVTLPAPPPLRPCPSRLGRPCG